MGVRLLTLLCIMALSPGWAATGHASENAPVARSLAESDRKVATGRLLLKWGPYVERVHKQDQRGWAAALWPSMAAASLDKLQAASRAVTYEGMRNALLGQRPDDAQIIDHLARDRSNAAWSVAAKAYGDLAQDLLFTPVAPCRIVDTRVTGTPIAANTTRALDAVNPGGTFTAQGGDAGDCNIPANPAALALSVTALTNTQVGYLRVYPAGASNRDGSPVPLNTPDTTTTNDMVVPACQGCGNELEVYSTTTTHYAAFVTGYFRAPQAKALTCFTGSREYKPGSPDELHVGYACPATHSLVGGSCSSGYGWSLVHSVSTTDNHECKFAGSGFPFVSVGTHCCTLLK
ncbi:MAG: hypothetical protein EOP02_06165 [Proteobacteria bacterium]|nr:MAG: hypothetical protein EOP02_06165 [Pseudomonadota bacterium]